MQLIVDSESALDIKRDMSGIEDIHTDKVSNGDIEQRIEQNCNGNKENIGDVNVIINDEKNKQGINADIEALPNLPTVIQLENTENESSIEKAQTEKACEEKKPESNGMQNEESQSNDTDTEVHSSSLIEKESEENGTDKEVENTSLTEKEFIEKPEELAQEAIVEKDEPIIQVEQQSLDQTSEDLEHKSEKVELETDKTKTNEELPVTEDDVEVIEESTETHMICETIPDVILEKPVPNVELKEPVSVIEDEERLPESSVDKEKQLESPEDKGEQLESSENKEKLLESSENKDKQLNLCENKDVQLDESKNEVKVTDSNSKEATSSHNACDLPPIEVKDDMDVEEVVDTTTTANIKKDDMDVEEVDETTTKKIKKDDMDVEEVVDTTTTNIKKDDMDVKEVVETTTKKIKKDDMDVEEVVDTTTTKIKKDDMDVKEVVETTTKKIKKDDMDVKEVVETTTTKIKNDDKDVETTDRKMDDMDVQEVVEKTKSKEQDTYSVAQEKPSPAPVSIIDKPILCKLSNTLDILSDDEEETPKQEPTKVVDLNEKQCIDIEDDDDIMLIDEDTTKTEETQTINISDKNDAPIEAEDQADSETGDKTVDDTIDLFTKTEEKDSTQPEEITDTSLQINVSEKQEEKQIEQFKSEVPLLPDNFLKSAKKNLAEMTREDLEEFCILKIVESIVDRSSLSEIKNKLKSMALGIDEYRKKAMMLTKQNRDLQVVLKSIQEEQKKMSPGTPITPLKITRSVGMQVFMEKSGVRRKNLAQLQNSTNTKQSPKLAPGSNLRPQKPPAPTTPIPVPRLVPANSPSIKSPVPIVNQITPSKPATPIPNGVKNPSPSQKAAEKRQHNRIMSVTVDLTDDEPPAKINNRTSPAPPVRVVPAQNLMPTPRQAFPTAVSSPRKVYIPISGQQSQNIRPGQTIMLKTVPTPGLRPRGPTPQVGRPPGGSVRINRVQTGRHPAPLPDAMKQYQPPNWKALPPAPDLKLSKVENGIVISWKIEGYQEDSYEEIASYQLYAYQETSSPPNTSLWKKIGDVKALPLPMACTLTQFMAGFKYFFAVRAVDIRSRLGPFSLPGSILLLNKL